MADTRHVSRTVTLTLTVAVEGDVPEGLAEETYGKTVPEVLAAMLVDGKRPGSIGGRSGIVLGGLDGGDISVKNHRVEILETRIEVE